MLVNGKEVSHLILDGETFDKKIVGRKIRVTPDMQTYRINNVGEIGFTKTDRPFSQQICSITGWLPSKDGNYVLLDYVSLNQGYLQPLYYKNQVFINAANLEYV